MSYDTISLLSHQISVTSIKIRSCDVDFRKTRSLSKGPGDSAFGFSEISHQHSKSHIITTMEIRTAGTLRCFSLCMA